MTSLQTLGCPSLIEMKQADPRYRTELDPTVELAPFNVFSKNKMPKQQSGSGSAASALPVEVKGKSQRRTLTLAAMSESFWA